MVPVDKLPIKETRVLSNFAWEIDKFPKWPQT